MSPSVDVWVVELDRLVPRLDVFRAALSPDESERASRFRSAVDQRRWSVARGSLRRVLAGYLDADPAALVFGQEAWQKPLLAGEHAAAKLSFNLTHAAGLALVAVSTHAAVGVDVEPVREMPDRDQVALRVFSRIERETLARLPAASRNEAFFNGWTRKEAVLKALCLGFGLDPASFSVSIVPGEAARVLEPPAEHDTDCFLCHLSPRPGYVAAMALAGARTGEPRLRNFELPTGA